ncbi:MAG: META domain-containing protein [Ilumatobacteraceae bacterium]
MTPRLALSAIAITALMLAACGSDDGDTSGNVPTAADLDGRRFVSTEVEGHELVADTVIQLGFDDGTLGATAGCNSLGGDYSVDDGDLVVGEMFQTMMGCDEALMEQDTWLNEFLTDAPSIGLDEDILTLQGGDVTMTFAEVEAPSIEGTTWIVTGTIANEAITSTPVDSAASLTITDGTAAVDTGCNTGSGSVEVTDSTLTFGPLATTRRACVPEINELEAAVLSVLDGEVTYEIDGDTLVIKSGDIGLEFTVAP